MQMHSFSFKIMWEKRINKKKRACIYRKTDLLNSHSSYTIKYSKILIPRAAGRSEDIRSFFIITLCILFKDEIADECQFWIINEIPIFLNVCNVSSLAKIIGMLKIQFAIFVLSNIISCVIGAALVIRIILEGTSQTFFLAAVGINFNLFWRVLCKGLRIKPATQAGFGAGF